MSFDNQRFIKILSYLFIFTTLYQITHATTNIESINNLKFSYGNREFLIVVLDDSFEAHRVSYIKDIGPCYPSRSISKEKLIQIADGFFISVGSYYGRRSKVDTSGLFINISFNHIAFFQDFVLFHQSPSDFGLVGIYYRWNGRLIYASTLNWWGDAEQIYPYHFNPIISDGSSQKIANRPDSIFIMTNDGGNKLTTFEGLDSILNMNIVSRFALKPYNILVYHTISGEGLLDVNNTEWVILLYRKLP